MSMPSEWRVRQEQHRVAQRLDESPAVARDHIGAAALEDLHQVADLVLGEGVGELAEADEVREAHRGHDVLVRRVGQALHPGHGRGEVASPHVDQQRLEVGPDRLDQAERLATPARQRRVGLDHPGQGGHLPLGEAVHRRTHATRQPDDRVEVEAAALHDRGDPDQRLDVVLAEGRLVARLGEAERAPQPSSLLDLEAGLPGDVVPGQLGTATENRVLELLRIRHQTSVRGGTARRSRSAAPAPRAGCRAGAPAPPRSRRRSRGCRSRRSGRPGPSRRRCR